MKSFLTKSFLWVYILSILMPVGWVVMSSLKTGADIFGNPWAPSAVPQFKNYAEAWSEAQIGTYFWNSVLVSGVTLAVLLPISAMAAYVFAKVPFPGRRAVYAVVLGGMMFPNFLVIVPLFLLMRDLHMLDTLWGLIVVFVAFSLSFSIFVLTGFFESVPDELAEAGVLDGASEAGIFWRIMLPIVRPGLLVVGILNLIGLWNEYSLSLVLIQSPENRTLPIGLANLTMVQHYQSNWGALFAAVTMTMLPMVAVYLLFRRRLESAMLAGALKG